MDKDDAPLTDVKEKRNKSKRELAEASERNRAGNEKMKADLARKQQGAIPKPDNRGGAEVHDPKFYAKARAKQAAFSSVGRVITPGSKDNNRFQGKYQMGWAKGMTPDQANEAFENKYETVSDAVKEKYARKGAPEAGLAPSERAKQLREQNPVPMGGEKPPITPQAQAGPSFEKLNAAHQASNGVPTTGPDGKIHAIGSGETKDGVYVGKPDVEKSPLRKTFDTAKNAVKEAAIDAIVKVGGTVAGPFIAPSDKAAIDKNILDNATERQMRYQEGKANQERLVEQNTAAKTGRPLATGNPLAKPFVGPPAPQNLLIPSAVSPAVKPPMGPPAPANLYDFEPGEGKELTGVVGGRKTYTKSSDLYGTAKTTAITEKPNQGVSPLQPPVMNRFDVQTQSIGQQRADSQARSQTPGFTPYGTRGPASREADPMSHKRNDPKVDLDRMKQYSEALKRQYAPGATVAYGKEANEIYRNSDEITKAAMGGVALKRDVGVQKPPPISQRVVSSRPATPEDYKNKSIRVIK